MMGEKDAPPTCTVANEVATINAEGMTSELIEVAPLLRANFDEQIPGEDESPPGTRAILEFAPLRLRSGKCPFKKFQPATIIPCLQQLSHELDPAIWSRLPEAVLEVVFAKLPVPEIHGLRCLSTQWKRKLVETRSWFRELCAKTSSRMFALISQDVKQYGLFWVKLYDMGINRWHVYKLFVAGSQLEEPLLSTRNAADGGLVCFLSAWRSRSADYPKLRVVVCNPLTQHVRTFALEGVSLRQVKLLQIVTDRDTRHYKLSIMWWRKLEDVSHTESDYVVEMFDSKTEEWTSLDIPGEDQRNYSWELFWAGRRDNWLWNFAHLRLQELDKIPIRESMVEDFALLRDRVFVLHEESTIGDCVANLCRCFVGPMLRGSNENRTSTLFTQYYITEYQRQEQAWTKLRTIKCRPFELPRSSTFHWVRLYASEGFLMVKGWNEDCRYNPDDVNHESGWLYDLSSDEWHVLPNMPGGVKLQGNRTNSLMCELRWDLDVNPLNVPNADHQFFLPVR